VIAERNGTNVADAFGLLRKAARDRNRRLSELAHEVVDGSAQI
jgi:AmiR/NasT family two-component response regulator